MAVNGTFPQFSPPPEGYNAFKLDRKCLKCKTGDAEGDVPAKASYNPVYDHILRQCATCGFLWWEAPKGD